MGEMNVFLPVMMNLKRGTLLTLGVTDFGIGGFTVRNKMEVICPLLAVSSIPIGILQRDVKAWEYIGYDPDGERDTEDVLCQFQFWFAWDFGITDTPFTRFIVDKQMKILGVIPAVNRGGGSGLTQAYRYWNLKRRISEDYIKFITQCAYDPEPYQRQLKLATQVWEHYDADADLVNHPAQFLRDLARESYPEAQELGFAGTYIEWCRMIRDMNPDKYGSREVRPKNRQNAEEK